MLTRRAPAALSRAEVRDAGWDRCRESRTVIDPRPSGERWTVTNDEAGIRQLLERLRSLGPELLVLKASVPPVRCR